MRILGAIVQKRLIQAIRRTPCSTLAGVIRIHLNFKFLCTYTAENLSQNNSEVQDNLKCLSYRIEKLPKGESVGSAFQSWMGDGFPVHRGDIFHAINRLRKLKMSKRALEVMEWVIRERPYRPRELDYSYLLEFTMKLHGILHGANFKRVMK